MATPTSGVKVRQVVVPPERHIGVAFAEMSTVVKGGLNVGQKHEYEEVCQLIECLYAQEFTTIRRELKQNFLAFSIGAKGQKLPTRRGKPLPTTGKLNLREEHMLENFMQLMAAARFNIVTHKAWTTAMEERFMFHLPVKVNWDFFDAKFLPRFWESSPERRHLRADLPDMADRVIIFHRGVGLAEDSGMYINQKIDLLVEYLVVWPILKIWAYICAFFAKIASLFRRRKPAAAPAALPAASPGLPLTAENIAASEAAAAALARSATSPRPSGQGNLAVIEEEGGVPAHRAVRVVERRTLRRVLPTAKDIILNIHKPLKLQEPMYKEVVMLYRASGKGRSTKKITREAIKNMTHEEHLASILGRRNIHIKCFHDIPMADMEVIFPDKKVFVKSLSVINMVLQAVMSFSAAIAGLWKAGQLDLKAVWSAVSLVAARCGQLYSNMQAERSRVIQEMVNIVFDKTNDAQEGVVSMLLEDMADQQLKEAVLAYTMLLVKGEEVSLKALDDLCEDWLLKWFDLNLDFATEDALPRLLKWGLVKYNPKTRKYRAENLQEAARRLSEAWRQAYGNIGKPSVARRFPLTALLPGGDRTPEILDDGADVAARNDTGKVPGMSSGMSVISEAASDMTYVSGVGKVKKSSKLKTMMKAIKNFSSTKDKTKHADEYSAYAPSSRAASISSPVGR